MSALATVLSKVIPAFKVEPSDAQNVFDYSTPEDFRKLWKFQGLPVDRILIIWARTAPDPDLAPINAADCLSPLDWAAAYVKKLAVDPVNWPEILILDATPEAHRKVPTLAHFHTLRPDQLPWLTVSSSPRLNDILEWCAKPKPSSESHAAYNTHCKAALDRFLREIRINLTEVRAEGDYDRHAISNVISPLLLGGCIHSDPSAFDDLSIHGSAVGRLLNACGAFAEIKAPQKPLVHDARPNILLVDDQAEHGWSKWLSQVFPKANEIQFQKKPTLLLKELKKQWKDKKSLDLRFRFRLPGLDDQNLPVLFLDLRLFSGDWNAEIDFYEELFNFVESESAYFCGNNSGEPISKETLDSIQSWLKSPKSEVSEHFEAMLLFPKVLSLADMSLPIVLFSSTSKRDLVAPLANYKNIFLGLQKNAVQIGSATHPQDYLHSIWPQIDSYAQWRWRFQALQQIETVPKLDGIGHWEIYIDESSIPEGNLFRVSGLLVGYPDRPSADAIQMALGNAGIRWRNENDAVEWVEGRTDWLGKPRNSDREKLLDDQWKSIRQKLEDLTSSMPVATCTVFKELPDGIESENSNLESPKLCDPKSLDNVFFGLLNDVIESFLFEGIPSLSDQKKVTIDIYAGNRRRVFSGTRCHDWINTNREAYARWGISLHLTPTNLPCYQAVQMDGMIPIVSELLQKRRFHAWAPALSEGIETVAGIPMNQTSLRSENGSAKFDRNGKLISPPYRHLHFVADIMASLAQGNGSYGVMTDSRFGFGPNNSSKGLFARRVHEDQGVGGLLRISRLLDERDANVASAASHFLKLDDHVNQLLEIGFFASSVLVKLRNALDRRLTGDHLNQLVSGTPGTLAVAIDLQNERKRLKRIKDAIRWEEKKKTQNTGITSAHNRTDRLVTDSKSEDLQAEQEKVMSVAKHEAVQTRNAQTRSDGNSELQQILKRRVESTEYKLRYFANKADYLKVGIPWHLMVGFYVRRLDTGEILVFALMWYQSAQANLSGFVVPYSNAFTENGDPIGERWKPDNGEERLKGGGGRW